MARAEAPSPREFPAAVYVGLGLLVGAAYVAFDVLAEAKLERGELTGALAQTHTLVDHLLPLFAFALLGLCIYQLRLRKRLHAAEEAASRAEALKLRLSHVERDQAVWLLAASVLHELNNPLHALGLLLDEQASSDAEPTRRAELNARARAQMNRILLPLAALRTLRSGADPDIRELSLDELVNSLAEEARTVARVRIDVDCPAPLRAQGDPHFVRTILENLIDNSLQALDGTVGGQVSLQLFHENERAVVRVRDDGPAVPAAVRAQLFDPLRSTKTHGLGLGLPIARALARAMHGELTLEPGVDKAFRLALPVEAKP